MSSVRIPETPSSRLNPSATTYTPRQLQGPETPRVPADLSADAMQLQKAYYEAQVQKVYREGMMNGRATAKAEGYREGYEQGRKAAWAEMNNYRGGTSGGAPLGNMGKGSGF
jgi:flagellar biosynthesis/type III secretory pathway protein FliH